MHRVIHRWDAVTLISVDSLVRETQNFAFLFEYNLLDCFWFFKDYEGSYILNQKLDLIEILVLREITEMRKKIKLASPFRTATSCRAN